MAELLDCWRPGTTAFNFGDLKSLSTFWALADSMVAVVDAKTDDEEEGTVVDDGGGGGGSKEEDDDEEEVNSIK